MRTPRCRERQDERETLARAWGTPYKTDHHMPGEHFALLRTVAAERAKFASDSTPKRC